MFYASRLPTTPRSGTTGLATGPALGAGNAGFDSPVPDEFVSVRMQAGLDNEHKEVYRVREATMNISKILHPLRL